MVGDVLWRHWYPVQSTTRPAGPGTTGDRLPRRGWRPVVDPRFVRRTQILTRLAEGLQGRLSTVIAGPGWGKSTALAQFLDDLAIPTAWCQPRSADANITAFTTLLCEAIAAEFPGFGTDLARDLAGIPAPNENWMAIARALSTEVTETVAASCVFAIDDYH